MKIFMKDHAGKSISVWMATKTLPSFTALTKNEHADVCIVGAGIAGLTTAYLLGRAGLSVIVLDDGPIVSGETERTTAHLSTALDDRYFDLEQLHGDKGARLAAESHAAAIDQIERIVIEEKIDCDFERVDGYLFVPPDESSEILEREMAATHRAGLTDTELCAKVPVASFDTGPALRFPRQAQFHPLKYLAALAQAIVRDGGRIYTETHASKIEGGEPARIETRGGAVVTAEAVVVATNTPVNDRLVIHTKQAAYRTFVIGASVPAGSVHKALYWDTPDPYHYVRLQSLPQPHPSSPASDLLIVGGEDHKTGHRSLIGDALLLRGIRTEDIMSPTRRQVHTLTLFAKVQGNAITYPTLRLSAALAYYSIFSIAPLLVIAIGIMNPNTLPADGSY